MVDSDLRKPTVHQTFDLPNKVGLTNLLTDRNKKVPDVIQYLSEANLCLLTSGPKPPNPSELLNSNRMVEVMREFNVAFDIVIYDLPPVIAVTDTQLMAPKVDGVVLVARNDVANKEDVRKAKELLDLSKGKILGAVLNGAEAKQNIKYGYFIMESNCCTGNKNDGRREARSLLLSSLMFSESFLVGSLGNPTVHCIFAYYGALNNSFN